MLSTELHRRTSLTPDGRPEKGGETPGRTTSKVLEFRQMACNISAFSFTIIPMYAGEPLELGNNAVRLKQLNNF